MMIIEETQSDSTCRHQHIKDQLRNLHLTDFPSENVCLFNQYCITLFCKLENADALDDDHLLHFLEAFTKCSTESFCVSFITQCRDLELFFVLSMENQPQLANLSLESSSSLTLCGWMMLYCSTTLFPKVVIGMPPSLPSKTRIEMCLLSPITRHICFFPLFLLFNSTPSLVTTVVTKTTCLVSVPSQKIIRPTVLPIGNLVTTAVMVVVVVDIQGTPAKAVGPLPTTIAFGLSGKPNLLLLASRKSVILTVLRHILTMVFLAITCLVTQTSQKGIM